MDYLQKDKYINLGFNIAYYRKLNKYTQMKLSELLDVDRSYISKIELGRVGVSLDIVFRLSDLFEIPAYKLFYFRD